MSQELSEINRPLGESIGILEIDVHGFSKHDDTQQQIIMDRLPEILRQAAARANLAPMWEDKAFEAFRGDGYVIGFSSDLVGAVVDRFFDSLQSELRRCAKDFRADGVELRVRTCLNLGPVVSFDEVLADSPTGRIMVETNRMVGAEAVRALLDNSDSQVTFIASVVSHTVMEQVVAAGRTTRKATEFVEAPLRAPAKAYSGKGYLRVPAPSGDLLRSGLLGNQPQPSTANDHDMPLPPEARGQVFNHVNGNAKNLVQARDVQGGIRSQVVRDATKKITVQGNNNNTAGRTVDLSSGKQEFSGEFHTTGDSNFGAASGRRISDDTDPEAR